jgi:hypothetical protein
MVPSACPSLPNQSFLKIKKLSFPHFAVLTETPSFAGVPQVSELQRPRKAYGKRT